MMQTIAPAPPRVALPTAAAWALILGGFALTLFTGGWFFPVAIGLYAISLTVAATWLADRAHDRARRRRWGLVAAALVAGVLLLLPLSSLQYAVFFREAGRSLVDKIGYFLFWPGAGLLVFSLLMMPLTRGLRVAPSLRAAAWSGAVLFAASLLLIQFGWIR